MEKKINYTGTHAHSHNKGGQVGALKGLIATKYFGAKRRSRHEKALDKKINGPKMGRNYF